MNSQNSIGNKFGSWTVISEAPSANGRRRFFCKCDCGFVKDKPILFSNLKNGHSRQCFNCARISYGKKKIGSMHGNMLILDCFFHNDKITYRVKCSCGTVKEILRLQSGVKACGNCIQKQSFPKQNVGKYFGRLHVMSYDAINKKYHCICSCGNKVICVQQKLRKKFASCGCHFGDVKKEKAEQLVGIKYYYLKIVKFLGFENSMAHYAVKCKCGKEYVKSINSLFASKSCGCYQIEVVNKGNFFPNSKLTKDDVIALRELFNTGLYSRRALCQMFNITKTNIYYIINNITWKHV